MAALCAARWSQCGGDDREGSGTNVCCPDLGLTCFAQSKFYSQCQITCPIGWDCTVTTALSMSATSLPNANTSDAVQQDAVELMDASALVMDASASVMDVTGHEQSDENCDFRFGTWFQGPDAGYENVDYLTVWIGQAQSNNSTAPDPSGTVSFNPYWHGAMLEATAQLRIGAAYYAYVIAFLARTREGCSQWDSNLSASKLSATRPSASIRSLPASSLPVGAALSLASDC